MAAQIHFNFDLTNYREEFIDVWSYYNVLENSYISAARFKIACLISNEPVDKFVEDFS